MTAMMRYMVWGLIVAGFPLFAACGGGGGEGTANLGATTPEDDGPGGETTQLQALATPEELETYLKNGIQEAGAADDGWGGEVPAIPEAGGDVSAAPAPPEPVYSDTNLQEAGVDEADRIKTDGEYLYMVVSAEPAFPEPTGIPPVKRPESDVAPYLRVMRLSTAPPESREVVRVSFADMENRVDGLYLLTDREGEGTDLLVTVGGFPADPWGDWLCTGCWRTGVTEVGIWDVGDPANPRRRHRATLDGRLISTRRIGNQLYLVTRYTPDLPEYDPVPGDPAAEERSAEILAAATLDDLLPRMAVNGTDVGALVAPERSFLPPREADALPEPGLITVTALDLDDPENRTTQSVAGGAETLYMSPESLFVATTRYPPPLRFEDDPAEDAEGPEILQESTMIHKFRLTREGPVYAGSGAVPGHLGWEVGKRPFRMSEYDGTLRVASSFGQTWNETARTRLTLLREDDAGSLAETGFVEHIGKPGERLYASRFAGGRGFLVTFRVTDPLYVFDLSDPRNPVAVGELEIEGYSDYLHLVGENLLLGIGKDAVPADPGVLGERGAWYQGLKLSLFDISDPSAPSEIDALVLGKRGTESEALFDHHGLAYLPPRPEHPARLALPIRLHDTPGQREWFDPTDPSAHYNWTHTGLYLFEVFDSGIFSAGRMIVAERTGEDSPWTWESVTGDRAVLLNDGVHYVHGKQVYSGEWGREGGMTGPR